MPDLILCDTIKRILNKNKKLIYLHCCDTKNIGLLGHVLIISQTKILEDSSIIIYSNI